MKQVREFMQSAIKIVNRPYMRILPGQLAFFWLMSLIPLVVVLGTFANYFSLTDGLNLISENLPVDIANLFMNNNISDGGLNFNIIVFFISAFILASNGMHSVIITTNEIYNLEDEGIVNRRVKAVAMTVVLVSLLFFLLIFNVFGNLILLIYVEVANNKELASFIATLFNYLKVPLSLLIIYYTIKQLYRMAPDEHISHVGSRYAAIFTTITWAIGTEIYAIYFKFFANYNLFYGSVSNLLILMIWLYFLAYVFVMGMAMSSIGKEE